MNIIDFNKGYEIANNWVKNYDMVIVDAHQFDDGGLKSYTMTDGDHTIVYTHEFWGYTYLRMRTELGWMEAQVQDEEKPYSYRSFVDFAEMAKTLA